VSLAGRHVVVMGVSGCGKSTLGALLARRYGVPFAEGDEFHSDASRAKMAAGIPLTDEDRWPWLHRLADWMSEREGSGSVVSCSALRRAYREILDSAEGDVTFVHLDVPEEELARRMSARTGHYMPPSLLASQLATLEPLTPAEDGHVLSAASPAAELADEVAARLAARDR